MKDSPIENQVLVILPEKLTIVFILFVTDEITSSFRRYGPLIVDWPHKAESKSYFPPKGYAFLLFQVSVVYIHFC